jgi:hypothetical protein
MYYLAPHIYPVYRNEWRSAVAIEERSAARNKIMEAYKKSAPTYEELLLLAGAIDEELIYALADSRIDYFKTGKI